MNSGLEVNLTFLLAGDNSGTCVCALFLDSDSTKLCVAEISGELLRECVYLLPQCSAIMKLLIVFAQAACASRKENKQKKKKTKATSFSHMHICVGNLFSFL